MDTETTCEGRVQTQFRAPDTVSDIAMFLTVTGSAESQDVLKDGQGNPVAVAALNTENMRQLYDAIGKHLTSGLLPISMFYKWLAQGERGTSSETLVSVVTGVPILPDVYRSAPRDGSDFRRCVELLDTVDEHTRQRMLDMMRQLPLTPNGKDWKTRWRVTAEHWDELSALFVKDMKETDGRQAPNLYKRMKELNL